MAQLKTQPTRARVSDFIDAIDDAQKKADAKKLAAMMRKATGSRATMWGTQIVGFGKYAYSNSKGEKLEFMLTGFSPRKQALSVYVIPGFKRFGTLLKKLGKHKTGKSCLYIRQLSDVDENVLQTLIDESVKQMREAYETR